MIPQVAGIAERETSTANTSNCTRLKVLWLSLREETGVVRQVVVATNE